MARNTPRRGKLELVVIASTTVLAACDHAVDNSQPEALERPFYLTVENCKEDWGSDDLCERSGQSETGGGGRVFLGPYYSAARGYYYGYDGGKRPLMRRPSNYLGVQSAYMTPSQVSSSSGRYASEKAASVERGGFGTKAGFFSGGG